MPEKNRGIGSEGLEQGGPDLGNDYSRPVGTHREAGDTVILPHKNKETTEEGNEQLNMDRESSRNLDSTSASLDNNLDENEMDDLDLDDDEDLDDLDLEEDDDEKDEENDII